MPGFLSSTMGEAASFLRGSRPLPGPVQGGERACRGGRGPRTIEWARHRSPPSALPFGSRIMHPLLLLLVLLFLGGCASTPPVVESDHPRVLGQQVVEGEAPSTPGPWTVGFLTYGSGEDRQRPEYAEEVAFTTTAVDASKMARRTEMAGFWRRYWGFDETAYPRNGRVWYPEGDGPFPLVLMVHGNHDPRRSSDRGYAYLGELLASRGFIFVSVDMNFLNGAIRGENDARGWMLLQHLKAWEGFTADPENPFHEKVDWERLALMGHSRGGEAVAHAAAFNLLRHYPDDASLTFDFGYRIRSLVAIAPVDGQYEPAARPVPLADVNYLTFHGSHDGDVTSFAGLRQFNRVDFTGSVPAFKAAVYMYRANHGQWNTGWGARDNGPRSGRILRLEDLLPMEDQLEFGRIYITAFLEATLLDETRWLPLFRDHRTAGAWLPPTMYKTRFEHSSFRPLADFSEDIDLTTGTASGVRLEGVGLRTWREGELVLRARLTPQRQVSQLQYGVWLGFRPEGEGDDAEGGEEAGETGSAEPPHYRILLEERVAAAKGAGPKATLDFQLAVTDVGDAAEGAGEGEEGEASEGGDPGVAGTAPGDSGVAGSAQGDAGPRTLDLTLTLVDGTGAEASLPLSRFGPLRAPLEVRVLRRRDQEESRFSTLFELVGHHFSLPLADFAAANPAFRAEDLREIRFVFDRTSSGEVILSQVGLSTPGRAFLEPRLPVAPHAPERPE